MSLPKKCPKLARLFLIYCLILLMGGITFAGDINGDDNDNQPVNQDIISISFGDVNDGGLVNVQDTIAVLKHVVGSKEIK